jgi:hypothetical protein
MLSSQRHTLRMASLQLFFLVIVMMTREQRKEYLRRYHKTTNGQKSLERSHYINQLSYEAILILLGGKCIIPDCNRNYKTDRVQIHDYLKPVKWRKNVLGKWDGYTYHCKTGTEGKVILCVEHHQIAHSGTLEALKLLLVIQLIVGGKSCMGACSVKRDSKQSGD